MRRIGLSMVVLLTGCAVAERHAGWTPAAGDLLFTSARDGNSEIYLRRAGRGDWQNLSQHEASDNWPVWSPDGSRIAFQSKRSGNLDIWVMHADGSKQMQLTSDAESDYLPSWSPDGTSITFASWRQEHNDAERAPHIYVMRSDGSEQRRLLVASPNTSTGAAWSPDGKSMVYSRQIDSEGADLFIADADGSNQRRITADQSGNIYNGAPEFSPDGRWIAFYSDDTQSARLQVIDVHGRHRRTILEKGHNWYPRWSPDGRWLVYTAASKEGEEGNTDVLAVAISGKSEPVLLIGSPQRDLEASWR